MKSLWCGVLVVSSQRGSSSNPPRPRDIPQDGAIVAAIVGVVAALAVVTYVVIHESSKKRTITGCVSSGENEMSLTDEKDKRSYALTGSTADVKPGDRVTLQGKRIKPKDAGKPLLWETKGNIQRLRRLPAPRMNPNFTLSLPGHRRPTRLRVRATPAECTQPAMSAGTRNRRG